MDIYSAGSYKQSIRLRVKDIQTRKPGVTLKKIAKQIPIQYTYLSKALNDQKTHLNEDHLFVICKLLDFLPEEMEFLQLQRSYEIASDSERRKYLFGKIEKLKKARNLNVNLQHFSSSRQLEEMAYLFNPMCMLVQICLGVDAIRQNPRSLCPSLGVTARKLKEILRVLERNNFIELEEDGITVSALKETHFHYGRDHPMMRVHQALFKTAIQTKLTQTDEEDKHSELATFTADAEAFGKIKDEFKIFLKKIEQIAGRSKHQNVYQISFDTFRWI